MRGPDWTHGRCTTASEYLALQAAHIAENARRLPGRYRGVRPFESDEHVEAFISHGKWVVMCACGNGPATSPEWQIACCFSCGAIYRDIEFPGDVEGILSKLKVRPMPNQNWFKGETVEKLEQENAEHMSRPGVTVRERK